MYDERKGRQTHLLINELTDLRAAALSLHPLRLLLKLHVEEVQEQLGEFLCVLLFRLLDLERFDERLGVVDGLLGRLEEREEDLELEDGRALRETYGERVAREEEEDGETHLDSTSRWRKDRVDAFAELGIAEPDLSERSERTGNDRRGSGDGPGGTSWRSTLRRGSARPASQSRAHLDGEDGTHLQADRNLGVAVVRRIRRQSCCLAKVLERLVCSDPAVSAPARPS